MKILPSPRQCAEFDGSLGYKISCDVCPWIWNFGKTSSSFESMSRFPLIIKSSSICCFIRRHRNCERVWKASSSVRFVYFRENCLLSTYSVNSYFQKISQDMLSVRDTKTFLEFLLLSLMLISLVLVESDILYTKCFGFLYTLYMVFLTSIFPCKKESKKEEWSICGVALPRVVSE